MRSPPLLQHIITSLKTALMIPSTQPLLRLLRYGKSYQVQVWGAVICSILRTLLDLAPPYLIGVAIDVVVEREASLLTQLGIQNPLT